MLCMLSSGMRFFHEFEKYEVFAKESFNFFAPIVKIGAFSFYLQLPFKKVAEASCILQTILLQCIGHNLSREDICT